MARIRINKDITGRWAVTTEGAAKSLFGRDLKLVITDPNGDRFNLPFVIEDSNVAVFNYLGKDQKVLGSYMATLYENSGRVGMNAVDSTDFVTLVSTTDEEDQDIITGINTASVSMSGDLRAGVQGKSAYEIAQIYGYTGTEREWLDSLKGANGLDGASLLNLQQTKKSTEALGENEWTATLSDGQTRTLKVLNGPQGPAGSGSAFIAVYGVTTIAQMDAAYSAGSTLLCLYNGEYYHLQERQSNIYMFCAFSGPWDVAKEFRYVECDSEEWVAYAVPVGGGGEANNVFIAREGFTAFDDVWNAIEAGKTVVSIGQYGQIGYAVQKGQGYADVGGLIRLRKFVKFLTMDTSNNIGYFHCWKYMDTEEEMWTIINGLFIPKKTSQLTNDSNFVPASRLAAVATTGSFNDLNDKPTIPEGIVVEDNLSSSSATSSLSANQGRVLKSLIDQKQAALNAQQITATNSGITAAMVEKLAAFLAGDAIVIKKMTQKQYDEMVPAQRDKTLCVIIG